jgi:serine/threonine protein kinase
MIYFAFQFSAKTFCEGKNFQPMKTIGPYRIERILGRGGMSTVYKVQMPVIEKIAALKCLDPAPKLVERMGMEALRRLFVREASRMAGFRHPNIAEVWNFEEVEGTPCYVMDFFCHDLGRLIGETYWADAPSRLVRLDSAVHYTTQILEGLRRMHHEGIIHRDIKPFNIMLTEDNTVKIADLGLSRARGEQSLLPDQIMVGTKFYAAPEQLASPEAVGPAADIYSTGVLMYRMLTGLLPGHRWIPPSQRNSNLDRDWDDFIRKATHPDPDRRFSGAGDMTLQLQQLYLDFFQKSKKACHMLPEGLDGYSRRDAGVKTQAYGLRSRPVKIGSKRAKIMFGLDDLWRPRVYAAAALSVRSKTTIIDRATGLLWQQGGSGYPLNWEQAEVYVDFLNQTRFAGRSDWRLPTATELISILVPPPDEADFCLASLFSNKQKWIWSADRRSFKSAWYVNVEMGFVASYDCSGFFYAKAVCSATGSEGLERSEKRRRTRI